MNALLCRETWLEQKDEKKENFIGRTNLQYQQLFDLRRVKGQCYMVLYGEDDVRPMWENQINIKALKEEVRTPLNTKWDCPLCQPYDAWTGMAEMDSNRRYMTRIVNPRYENGTVDEGGVYKKCVCILKPARRGHLKFKKDEAIR